MATPCHACHAPTGTMACDPRSHPVPRGAHRLAGLDPNSPSQIGRLWAKLEERCALAGSYERIAANVADVVSRAPHLEGLGR